MTTWKAPPAAKIYEALSAVADGRVTVMGRQEAEVTSSSGTKVYVVEWSEDEKQITSNDNASYWCGYLGYPILAVLMIRGKIRFDPDVARLLSGVHWKAINTQYKNNYEEAVRSVLNEVGASCRERITAEVARIDEEVKALQLGRLHRSRRPPKEQSARTRSDP